MLTKEHAEKIARKLNARIVSGARHDIAVVEHNGKRVLQFGIRRGSRKDQGHGHIPGSIHLNPRDALLLAQCPLSRDEWIRRMRDKRLIVG